MTRAAANSTAPSTRKIALSEHRLSFPANLSWALWGLAALCLAPIAGLPAAAWIAMAAWLVLNLALTGLVLATRTVPLEPERDEDPEAVVEGTSLFRDAMRRLRRNQFATLSAGLLVLLVFLCFGQQAVMAVVEGSGSSAKDDPESFYSLHIDPFRINKEESFAPPSRRHWFGTDALGRDLFARTLYGGRISFLVGLFATAVSLVVGVIWGAFAGYYGGRLDNLMMRIVDVLYGLPFMFLVILFLTLVNGLHSTASAHREAVDQMRSLEAAGKRAEAESLAEERGITRDIRIAVFLSDNVKPIYAMFIALGLVSWLTLARIVRGQMLSLKQREFVLAARTIGAGATRIIFRHIVPNLLGPVIVYTTLTIPTNILAEAFLSFLGLGVSQPECSWGSLASEGLAGINVVKPYWWLITYPSAAISLALFSLNFIGDGLRDALDPRMQR